MEPPIAGFIFPVKCIPLSEGDNRIVIVDSAMAPVDEVGKRLTSIEEADELWPELATITVEEPMLKRLSATGMTLNDLAVYVETSLNTLGSAYTVLEPFFHREE